MSEFARGDLVTYETFGVRRLEHGVVMEVRGSLVMVRYGADEYAKATRPGDLRKASIAALTVLHRGEADRYPQLHEDHELLKLKLEHTETDLRAARSAVDMLRAELGIR